MPGAGGGGGDWVVCGAAVAAAENARISRRVLASDSLARIFKLGSQLDSSMELNPYCTNEAFS